MLLCGRRRRALLGRTLKLTEGRCTGIPTIRKAMRENGSPEPIFSTDEERTHFLAELPIHPQMKKAHVEAHVEAHDEAHDDLTPSEQRIIGYLKTQPRSRAEIAGALGITSRSGSLYKSIDRLRAIGILNLTIPERPRSKQQKMRLTAKGQCISASCAKLRGTPAGAPP